LRSVLRCFIRERMTALKELKIWREIGGIFSSDQDTGDVVVRAWLQTGQQRGEHGCGGLAHGDDSKVLQRIEVDWLGSVNVELEAAILLGHADSSGEGALDAAVCERLPEDVLSHVS
jgi:hypothetical protein